MNTLEELKYLRKTIGPRNLVKEMLITSMAKTKKQVILKYNQSELKFRNLMSIHVKKLKII